MRELPTSHNHLNPAVMLSPTGYPCPLWSFAWRAIDALQLEPTCEGMTAHVSLLKIPRLYHA